MAIWQFDLSLVPRAGPMPWRVDEGHEVPPLQEAPAVQAHAWLCEHLGEPRVMLEDWLVFGEEQGNRVDFLFNEDGSANLTARIDARSQYEKFICGLCELTRISNCLLFSAEQWAAVEPSVAEVSAALERSRAVAFVRNPLHVLRRGTHGG
jgi:hypothetical protein